MERFFKIKKGLNLNLKGQAQQNCKKVEMSAEYALSPSDFYGIVPRLVVKEGEHVMAGSPLFVDKATERIKFVSPVSGMVKAIVRGERRKILYVTIAAEEKQQFKDFGEQDLSRLNKEAVLDLLLDSGLFGFFRQRPYDVVASPLDTPKAIFISTFSKMPLAADFSYVIEGREAEFSLGIKTLAKLSKVYVGISAEQAEKKLFTSLSDAEVNVFDGPNPAGNVSVHINRVSPINKGEIIWTISPEIVAIIGKLVQTGKIDFTRRIALAGSQIKSPGYVDTIIGAPVADLLKGQLTSDKHVRLINGNPLVGIKTDFSSYLSAQVSEFCVIPEGDDVHELLGWIAPRLNDFSTNHSYFSWLFGRKKEYDLDCRIKGGERHMIMSCEYESVFPMDIYPSYLIKAIITGDIDRQEALGIYEVAPEDFAVAEFIDSSKLELQRIVREGLDILRKENS